VLSPRSSSATNDSSSPYHSAQTRYSNRPATFIHLEIMGRFLTFCGPLDASGDWHMMLDCWWVGLASGLWPLWCCSEATVVSSCHGWSWSVSYTGTFRSSDLQLLIKRCNVLSGEKRWRYTRAGLSRQRVRTHWKCNLYSEWDSPRPKCNWATRCTAVVMLLSMVWV